MTNWIVDTNPWNLSAPPEWVLQQMATYDNQLVLMPGLAQPVYRLMRYSKAAKAFKPLMNDSESARCWKYGVVPVTSILPNANWHSLILWLQTHDIWAHGGAEGAERALIEKERAEAEALDRASDDALDQRGASSWFARQSRDRALTFVRKETVTGA